MQPPMLTTCLFPFGYLQKQDTRVCARSGAQIRGGITVIRVLSSFYPGHLFLLIVWRGRDTVTIT